ncbi:hypothetical protein DL96DRAFT_697305 [Flagelloscypha sp. PMI_526]|nr:hypothetical protein DL96DRAFT_697305 [Flagelloscypha sp. PMI_526]
MAHRVYLEGAARRHNIIGRQFDIGDLFGGGADSKDTSTPVGPIIPKTTTTTSIDDGPTAGPIINRPTFTTTTSSSPPPVVNTPAPPPVVTTSSTPTTTSTTPITSSTSTSSVVIPTLSTSVPIPSRTLTVPQSASSAAAAESTSAAPAAAASSNVGAIIGGIAAGVAGVVILVFAITYFLRRKRNSRLDDDAFNPDQFRRSAVLMPDSPTHDDILARGFNPAPHHGGMAQFGDNAPVTYGNVGHSNYGADNGVSNSGYGAGNYGGDAAWNQMSPPPTAQTSQPFMNDHMAQGYGFNPASPVSDSVAPYDSAYNQANFAHPSTAGAIDATTAVSAAHAAAAYPSAGPIRRNSGGSQRGDFGPQTPGAQYASYPGVDANGSPRNSATDYLELSRSSVTPFQAAQYKIISNKLGAPVPEGLQTPIVEEQMKNMTPPPMPNNEPMVSPFDDDNAASSNGHDSLPVPPPPAATRITSTPPMLPEIRMSNGLDSPSVQRSEFPMTPSPMVESFEFHQASAPAPSSAQIVQRLL